MTAQDFTVLTAAVACGTALGLAIVICAATVIDWMKHRKGRSGRFGQRAY